MSVFKALLKQQKDCLSYVSRSHLSLELADCGRLKVTNASQNIALLNSQALRRGESALVDAGDTLSFAAQVELLQTSASVASSAAEPAGVSVEKSSAPGSGNSSLAPKEDNVPEKISITPFLTFRLRKVA